MFVSNHIKATLALTFLAACSQGDVSLEQGAILNQNPSCIIACTNNAAEGETVTQERRGPTIAPAEPLAAPLRANGKG